MPANRYTSTSPALRNNLPRGKACMSCRRRKIKCDGRKPACGQCRRSPGTSEDCEYPIEGRSRTQQLEETIKKLHSRIGELEAAAEGGMYLHEPYDNVVEKEPVVRLRLDDALGSPPKYLDSWSASPRSTSPTSRIDSPISLSSSSRTKLDEPSHEVATSLIDTFLSAFSQAGFGFFLSPASFRRCALQLIQGPIRPSPALLNAVFMWGEHLTSAGDEETFLSRALHHIHTDISRSQGSASSRVLLDSIQAEVLLALYYLTLGRPVEGTYHSSAAVSLALSAGLHRLGSSSNLATISPLPFDLTHPVSSPFPDPDLPSESERIAAFWTVLIVSNHWSVAHSPAAGASALSSAEVNTPWPRDEHHFTRRPSADDWLYSPTNGFSDYDNIPSLPLPAYSSNNNLHEPSSMVEYPAPQYQPQPHSPASTRSPISRFLDGELDPPQPHSLAQVAQASILLEKAVSISARYIGFPQDDHAASAFVFLDQLIDRFGTSMPPKDNNNLTQLLVRGAIIRLHHPQAAASDSSRRKALDAALGTVGISHQLRADRDDAGIAALPFLGVLWSAAAEVLLGEFALALRFGAGGSADDLLGALETLLNVMRASALRCPLLDYFTNRVQQQYENLASL
ncbi:Zn(2)-Cys(6) binuclear cluster domain-containing protein [Mycena indigotica]|uniref:Zn(2)-Cys(6) binuclear cluster domain-containing protein n=1 Tax=Mycena indigotica TaxID=2126181 RepID=A0A8H6S0S1_9AGAR|nr:Zn(2)-Cys(6) binuclear cluster domain-containing protein [Mycena indigotica]KAF7290213.1 Zn(2)-Cys(6) binuclear cluster domain-containing protein [Mycena indigotica]